MKKRRFIAIVLSILGGFCGLQRVYLTHSPFWFLTVFFAPLGALYGLWEAYKLVYMDENEFDMRYNATRNQRLLANEATELERQRIRAQRLALERQNALEEARFRTQLQELQQTKQPVTGEMADQLAAWAELREKGLISEIEFEDKRKQILGR